MYILQRSVTESEELIVDAFYVVQMTTVYDEATLTKTQELHKHFGRPPRTDILLPQDVASDFNILAMAAFANELPCETFDWSRLQSVQRKARDFSKTLHAAVETDATENIQDIFAADAELADAFYSTFVPPLQASGFSRVSLLPSSHTPALSNACSETNQGMACISQI